MNKCITKLVSRIESIFIDSNWSSYKGKGFFILAIVLVVINFFITLIFSVYPILSYDFFMNIVAYSFVDYMRIAILISAFSLIYKKGTQDKILHLIQNDISYDFDIEKHPRYSLTFRLKTYFNNYFVLLIICAFIHVSAMPYPTECLDYKEINKIYDTQNNYRYTQYECLLYESNISDRLGNETIFIKENSIIISNFDNIEIIKDDFHYVFRYFLILFPIVFLGVRQGIWSRTNIEKNSSS